jgi:hypothetical protein
MDLTMSFFKGVFPSPGLLGSVASLLLAFAPLQAAQKDADKPPPFSDRSLLKIVGVDVQPANPGPDVLCKLRVRLHNSGKQPASDLGFRVTVNGQRLASYVNHVFHTTLEPDKDTDLPLYNFWSSEASRPYPGDGRLALDVRVIEARWLDSQSKSPTGAVEPLPPPFTVTLTKDAKR